MKLLKKIGYEETPGQNSTGTPPYPPRGGNRAGRHAKNPSILKSYESWFRQKGLKQNAPLNEQGIRLWNLCAIA
jgi:hypothetical protein